MPEIPSTAGPHRAITWSIAIFCLFSVLISGRQSLWYFSHGPTASDFRIFMTGIEMVRSGEGHNLYRFDAQKQAQKRLYPETSVSGLLPFNHLAFELLYYWPFSWLPYRTAILAWAFVNLGVVFLIAWLMKPYTSSLNQRTSIPIAFLLLAFYPVIFTLGEGQDSLIFLFLLVVSLRAMDANRPSVAGFVLALACFKLHLVLAIAFFVFFLRGKWRGLAGFAAGCTLVVGISAAMVGPRMIPDYLSMLRKQGEVTPWGFIPWYMPNLRGILQWGLDPWLDLGRIIPIIFVLSLFIAVIGGWVILHMRGREQDLVFSAAILTTIPISYHFHVQDLSLAALPMLVLLNRFAGAEANDQDSTITGTSEAEFSPVWRAMAFASVLSLYFLRPVAELFPWLVFHTCLLCVPLLFLWLVALRTSFSTASVPYRLPAFQST
jgi:hypothetical protein